MADKKNISNVLGYHNSSEDIKTNLSSTSLHCNDFGKIKTLKSKFDLKNLHVRSSIKFGFFCAISFDCV